MKSHPDVTLTDGVIKIPASNFDVSRLNIVVTSALLWEPGTTLSLRIRLPNGRTAVARALVNRWLGSAMELSVITSGPAFSRWLARTFASISLQDAA